MFNFSDDFSLLSDSTRLLAGDHLRLIDNCGSVIGSGVLVKSDDTHFLIKNLRSKQLKRVERGRYKVYYKKHTPKTSDLGKQLRAILAQRQEAHQALPGAQRDPFVELIGGDH